MFKCPNEDCDDNGDFAIDNCEEVYDTTAYVNEEGDVLDTTQHSGGTEWDDDNPMRCRDCGYAGTVKDFSWDGGDA